jgi:hypothetical protein
MKKIVLLLIGALVILPAASCRRQEAITVKPDLSRISGKALEDISSKKILFFHMSVGNNILDGIREIQEQDPRFKSVEIRAYEPGSEVRQPGLYHFMLGYNHYPDKKVEACESTLFADDVGRQFDVIVFKYCYVDFRKDSDVGKIFSNYSRMISGFREKFPDLEIVHVTVPLTVRYLGLRGWLRFQLGKTPPNDQRSEFNELLEGTFGNTDRIFDLAGLESTDSRGKKLSYDSNGRSVPYLAGEYTDDGGHLNRAGRLLAAIEFLKAIGPTDLEDERR